MITTTDYEKNEIHNRIRAIGAKTILEIGAFKGETTRLMVDSAGEGARVVVIDPMSWSSEVLRNGIARHISVAFPRLRSATSARYRSSSCSLWRSPRPPRPDTPRAQ